MDEEVFAINRIIIALFAVLLCLAFFIPRTSVSSSAAPSGQVFTVDRVEEGIAALCSEDGLCFFIPEAALGQASQAGTSVILGAASAQSPASERHARLELKVGDLLDDM